MNKKISPKPASKKEFKFFHKKNKAFTGYLLNETDDFYTIELTSGVAGLNNIWYEGEIIMWSKELTSILGRKRKSYLS
ncbi:MAG: hypothetical protein ABR503_00110 [Chitinophagaceae bacterium]